VIGLPLRLHVLGFGPALLVSAPLLSGMILFVGALFMLSEGRSRDSEKQSEHSRACDSNYFHVLLSPQGAPSKLRLGGVLRTSYRKLPVCGLTALPIASPDTRSSTRRFCCRPEALSFEATARLLPKPLAVTAAVATPCWTR
jgi:hypothetical protein